MEIAQTALPGVVVVGASPFTDHRGAFARFYCERELAPVIGERRIVQVSHSRTQMVGSIRGLHFQHPPYSEMKLVRCLKGRVWDIAVDLRAGSPTFLQWHAEELTPGNAHMLVIPEGCAHGFQVLEEESELLYLATAFYDSDVEGGVLWDDPRLAISWPLPVTDASERDRSHTPIGSDFAGLVI